MPIKEIPILPVPVSKETDTFFAACCQAFNAVDLQEASRYWAGDCRFRTRPGFPDRNRPICGR